MSHIDGFHGAWLIMYTTSGGQEAAGLLAVRLYAGIAEKSATSRRYHRWQVTDIGKA